MRVPIKGPHIMNKPIDQSQFQTPDITLGALPSSSKVYTAPDADPSLRVPHRLCLLYTSPSPRDGLLSRMPSSA